MPRKLNVKFSSVPKVKLCFLTVTYTLSEFLKDFELGTVVFFRDKKTHEEYHYLFNGYYIGEIEIVTLGTDFSFSELFDNFELNVSGVFKPFGVPKS